VTFLPRRNFTARFVKVHFIVEQNTTIKAYREYSEFKNADNLLKYLLKVENKYLGKKI
jgi:hypothetical protein